MRHIQRSESEREQRHTHTHTHTHTTLRERERYTYNVERADRERESFALNYILGKCSSHKCVTRMVVFRHNYRDSDMRMGVGGTEVPPKTPAPHDNSKK